MKGMKGQHITAALGGYLLRDDNKVKTTSSPVEGCNVVQSIDVSVVALGIILTLLIAGIHFQQAPACSIEVSNMVLKLLYCRSKNKSHSGNIRSPAKHGMSWAESLTEVKVIVGRF